MNSYMFWLLAASLILYVVWYNDQGLTLLYFLSERVRILGKRLNYAIWNNPDMFWVRFKVHSNTQRDAKKMAKALGLDKNEDWNK